MGRTPLKLDASLPAGRQALFSPKGRGEKMNGRLSTSRNKKELVAVKAKLQKSYFAILPY